MTMDQPEPNEAVRRAVVSAIHKHWVLFLVEGIVLVLLGAAAIILPEARYTSPRPVNPAPAYGDVEDARSAASCQSVLAAGNWRRSERRHRARRVPYPDTVLPGDGRSPPSAGQKIRDIP